MAKSKQETKADEFEAVSPAFTPPADDGEALRARIAELEAELAEARSAPAGEAFQIILGGQEVTPAGATRRWRVSLQDAPTWVVEAADAANAWEAYKAATGVIASQYTHHAAPTDEPLGRAG